MTIMFLMISWLKGCDDFDSGSKDFIRISILLAGLFLTVRYLFWRVDVTLGWNGSIDFVFALILFLAELYGIAIYVLGMFVNIQGRTRKVVPLPDDQESWPTVDVLIPTFNEDEDLLEVTVLAATHMDYPRHKLNIYLLDDGGTDAKREQEDKAKSLEAHKRHLNLRKLAANLGVQYLTRKKNDHAKAGNLNAALEHIHGDLVLILDADHVPAEDFLQKTVGFFTRDEKLFLVQTPHHFLNPDPIEKNLQGLSEMPSEHDMFYGVVQKGLDAWGASFFCGSAALIRRRCLDEIGGIQGTTITEDAETALELHSRGYHSVYYDQPLIAGLQPETLSSFIIQRMRWAQGMVQIFLLKNPLLKNGLSIAQRLSYTSSSLFWFFPLARTVFLLAPVAYLIFGLGIYDANLDQVMVYALPHVVGAFFVSDVLYGKHRWSFISELYETMQSIYSLPAILKVFKDPRSPSFNVTTKGEQIDTDFITSLSKPFIWLSGLTMVAIIVGVWRWFVFPDDRDIIIITTAWECFNMYILMAALGALLERKQRRVAPRLMLPMNRKGKLWSGNVCYDVFLTDVSTGGAGLKMADHEIRLPAVSEEVDLVIQHDFDEIRLHGVISGKFGAEAGLKFLPKSLLDKRQIVRLIYGDSSQLSYVTKQRRHYTSFHSAAFFLFSVGVKGFWEFIGFSVKSYWHQFKASQAKKKPGTEKI